MQVAGTILDKFYALYCSGCMKLLGARTTPQQPEEHNYCGTCISGLAHRAWKDAGAGSYSDWENGTDHWATYYRDYIQNLHDPIVPHHGAKYISEKEKILLDMPELLV